PWWSHLCGLLRGLSKSLSYGLAPPRPLPSPPKPHGHPEPRAPPGASDLPPPSLGPTTGCPQLKGEPNSANRKCFQVWLSRVLEAGCFISGEGHGLQEHHALLVQGSCPPDLPGVKLTIMCSGGDCGHMQK
uniref:Small ribosomal subunit protein uS12m n=1 Tax=Equus asinus asinus TaxID=83772 RepID=A0A8C4PTI9_EQUAS